MNENAYSFIDTFCTLTGPGGSISLGYGSGSSEEGITFEPFEEIDRMTVGADGNPMHSLIAGKAAKGTVRLQKTSPVNSQLDAMLSYQRTSALFHGRNILSLSNPVSGDAYYGSSVAFSRLPPNSWAKEAGMIEWEFNIGKLLPVIGPNIA